MAYEDLGFAEPGKVRDAKIMSLYEGTNGIQSIDLMGRKMRVNDGAMFMAFSREIQAFFENHRGHAGLGTRVADLEHAFARVSEMADQMKALNPADPLQWASYTYPALLCFGDLVMAWRFLDMALIAWDRAEQKGGKNDFYRGKVAQATYFVDMTLPHTITRAGLCTRSGRCCPWYVLSEDGPGSLSALFQSACET